MAWTVTLLDERVSAELDALPADMRAKFERIVSLIISYGVVLATRTEPGKGGRMRRHIPVEEAFARWREDPTYREAHASLEEEFAIAAALIEARASAGLSQEEVADRMQTSQSAVARLEGGKANMSVQTLRRFAEATGTRLKISFEPSRH